MTAEKYQRSAWKKKLKRKTSNNEHENKKMTYRDCTDVNSLT